MNRTVFFLSILISIFCFSMEWSDPTYLSVENQNASEPDLSMSVSTGNGAACWSLSNGSISCIQVSLFDGTNWSEPVTLSDEAYHAMMPSIQINHLGHVIAIWKRILGASTSCVEACFFDGSSWSDPVVLSSSTYVCSPSVSMSLTEDSAVAIWRESNGIGNLRSSLFDGSDWTEIEAFSPRSNVSSNPISINENNWAITCWITPSALKPLQVSLYNSEWSSALTLGTTACLQANVKMDPVDNRAAVIWSDLNRMQIAIWNGSAWGEPRVVCNSSLFLIEPSLSYHPSDGSFCGIWRGDQGVQAIINNGFWSDLITLREMGVNPKAAFNVENEKVGAIWSASHAIEFTEFDEETTLLPVILSDRDLIASNPSLEIDLNGNALALWKISDGMNTRIEARRGIP